MRKLKIAINGLGIIGRLIVQTLIDDHRFQIVALNDPASPLYLAPFLNRFPSQLQPAGRFTFHDGQLNYCSQTIPYTRYAQPIGQLWGKTDCDLLIEASGRFNSFSTLQTHLQAGAKRIFITTNFQEPELFAQTLIYNFNHHLFNHQKRLWSFGSCTTNSLLLTLKACQSLFAFSSIQALTIHSVTNQQTVLNRLATQLANSYRILDNLLPARSNATRILKYFFPSCQSHVAALRVPTTSGSLLILNLGLKAPIDSTLLLHHLQQASNSSFQIRTTPLTLIDLRAQKTPVLLDWTLTVNHKTNLQLGIWYDNEIGYVQQIYQTLIYLFHRLN